MWAAIERAVEQPAGALQYLGGVEGVHPPRMLLGDTHATPLAL